MISFRDVTIPRKFLIPALLILVGGAGACANVLTAGAALVNGSRISQSELDRQVDAQLKNPQAQPPSGEAGRLDLARQVLLNMIQQELLRQESTRRGLSVAAAEVQKQFNEIRSQFASDTEFASRIKDFGLTRVTLRARIADSLLVNKLRDQLAGDVTQAQIRQLYDQQLPQFRQIKVKHILFSIDATHPDAAARKAANAAFATLKSGANFTALAKTLSQDPGSKDKGGVLPGFIALSDLDPSFGRAAFAAPIGVVTKPVRSSFGYHLIVTLAKRTKPLSEVAAQLRAQLQQTAGETALSTFVQTAVSKASIVVNPRYGDWDAATGTIVAHASFVPAVTAPDQNAPGGFVVPGHGDAPPASPHGG